MDFAPGHMTDGGLSTRACPCSPSLPSLPCPACNELCRPRFYGDPVGDSRHHLDWDSPIIRSIPLKEGRERDTEPGIPRGGPGGPLGHLSTA